MINAEEEEVEVEVEAEEDLCFFSLAPPSRVCCLFFILLFIKP